MKSKYKGIKGLPSKVEFNKEDWEEHLILGMEQQDIIDDYKSKYEESKKETKSVQDDMNYLVKALENTFSTLNKVPEGSYKIAVKQEGQFQEDRKPILKFIPKNHV